jgi:hypothetical protein
LSTCGKGIASVSAYQLIEDREIVIVTTTKISMAIFLRARTISMEEGLRVKEEQLSEEKGQWKRL